MIQLLFIFLLASTNVFAQTKCERIEETRSKILADQVNHENLINGKVKMRCFNASTGEVVVEGYVDPGNIKEALFYERDKKSFSQSPRLNKMGDFVVVNIEGLGFFEDNLRGGFQIETKDFKNENAEVQKQKLWINQNCNIADDHRGANLPDNLKPEIMAPKGNKKVNKIDKNPKSCTMPIRCNSPKKDENKVWFKPKKSDDYNHNSYLSGIKYVDCSLSDCYSIFSCLLDKLDLSPVVKTVENIKKAAKSSGMAIKTDESYQNTNSDSDRAGAVATP